MMVQGHVLGLSGANAKDGTEAVELESVESVVQGVLHQRQDSMNTLLSFELSTVDILEQIHDYILKLGGNAVEVFVGKVDERIDEGLWVVAKVLGKEFEVRISGGFFLLRGRRC